jgi:hypothetical protein
VTPLTSSERLRFLEYLRQEVASNEAIIRQMEKMGGPVMEALTRRYRAEVAACKVVANKLTNVENVTLTGTKATQPKEATSDK